MMIVTFAPKKGVRPETAGRISGSRELQDDGRGTGGTDEIKRERASVPCRYGDGGVGQEKGSRRLSS
jgi:hypothetical protein